MQDGHSAFRRAAEPLSWEDGSESSNANVSFVYKFTHSTTAVRQSSCSSRGRNLKIPAAKKSDDNSRCNGAERAREEAGHNRGRVGIRRAADQGAQPSTAPSNAAAISAPVSSQHFVALAQCRVIFEACQQPPPFVRIELVVDQRDKLSVFAPYRFYSPPKRCMSSQGRSLVGAGF